MNRPIIAKGVREYLPYMATENLMMAAVAAGGDRQEAHKLVRDHSHAVTARIKAGEGHATEIFERLQAEKLFAAVDFAGATAPEKFVGRAPEQVAEFLAEHVAPIRARYAARMTGRSELTV